MTFQEFEQAYRRSRLAIARANGYRGDGAAKEATDEVAAEAAENEHTKLLLSHRRTYQISGRAALVFNFEYRTYIVVVVEGQELYSADVLTRLSAAEVYTAAEVIRSMEDWQAGRVVSMPPSGNWPTVCRLCWTIDHTATCVDNPNCSRVPDPDPVEASS